MRWPTGGALMASKIVRWRRLTSVPCLRRRAGRRLPTTNSLGIISWRPRKIPKSLTSFFPASWRQTRHGPKPHPVLVLGVVSLRFAKNQKDNRAAVHDLGLASGNLVMEATTRGLSVHQMIGILPDKAREVYQIPEHFEAWTAMAIGYNADPATMPAALKERDMAPRQRRPLRDFVFAGHWKVAAPLVIKREP
jgi:hypothetical protein